MLIKYLKHNEIDFERWDKAVYNSVNGLVYATSWYLNIVNPNWEALVTDDYDIVMPLTYRKKYGIKYLYKPFFSQFLGVFYQNEEFSQYVKDFINQATKYFKYINININVSNSCFDADYVLKRQTQVLNLNRGYEQLNENYSRSTHNNVKKAQKEGTVIKQVNSSKELISLIRHMYAERNVIGVKEQDYKDLNDIINYATKNNMGKIYHVLYNGQICAASFFLQWKDRVISLQTANNNKGREKRALFKLLDYIICQYANSNLLLDFAGSNIPGVAEWNLGFGSKHQYYYTIEINKMNKIIKWLKNR
mgnify:FL=1